jgi:hypothetical protein
MEQEFKGCPPGHLPCIVCGTPCSTRCVQCHKVGYCGREHQLQHWKTRGGGHKVACKLDITVFGHYFHDTEAYSIDSATEAELLRRLELSKLQDPVPVHMQREHKACRDLADYYSSSSSHTPQSSQLAATYAGEALRLGKQVFGPDHVLCVSDEVIYRQRLAKLNTSTTS